jgi:hypothetical protein
VSILLREWEDIHLAPEGHNSVARHVNKLWVVPNGTIAAHLCRYRARRQKTEILYNVNEEKPSNYLDLLTTWANALEMVSRLLSQLFKMIDFLSRKNDLSVKNSLTYCDSDRTSNGNRPHF